MGFEFFAPNSSFVNTYHHYNNNINNEGPCSSSLNLEIPLHEDTVAVSNASLENTVPEPADIRKPRFRITHIGRTKPEKALKSITEIIENDEKSAFSYRNLTFLALLNAPNNQGYVSDIYEFIAYNFPFYSSTSLPWKNCIRTFLCKSGMFERIQTTDRFFKYRGDSWKIKHDCYKKLLEGVNKTIARNSFEDLKIRKDVRLDAILGGRAGLKASPAVQQMLLAKSNVLASI